MTTYAIAPDKIPDADYLTPGKRYAVLTGDDRHPFDMRASETAFSIADDEGDTIFCTWRDCPHAGGDWTRVDEED